MPAASAAAAWATWRQGECGAPALPAGEARRGRTLMTKSMSHRSPPSARGVGPARVVGVGLERGDGEAHPRAQRQRAEHLLVEFVLVTGTPDADAAQLADRAPQPCQVAGGGQFPGADGLGGAPPVD